MPKPQAAVPFVNQKGQRSMKRVKVERYRPGKVPSYAIGNQDDDDEYYTDDEDEGNEDLDEELVDHESRDEELEINARHIKVQPAESSITAALSDTDSDQDDPRMRKLKEISKRSNILKTKPKLPKLHESSDDETEEQIRMRHLLARNRIQEPPLGTKSLFPDLSDSKDLQAMKDELQRQQIQHDQSAIIDTDDILGEYVPTGLKAEDMRRNDEVEAQERFLDLLEDAKEEAILRSNFERKLEEDIRIDNLRESREKSGFLSYEITSINTDDESEEFGPEYEAWKSREINRIVRYRSELMVN